VFRYSVGVLDRCLFSSTKIQIFYILIALLVVALLVVANVELETF